MTRYVLMARKDFVHVLFEQGVRVRHERNQPLFTAFTCQRQQGWRIQSHILNTKIPSGQNTHAATAELTDTKRVRESSSTGHCQCNGTAVFFKAKASSTKADRFDPGGSLFKSRWIAI